MFGYKTCLWLSGLMMFGMLVALWLVYPDLPEKMVTHYNFAGKADGWGHKSSIFLIVGIQTAQFVLLAILSRYH